MNTSDVELTLTMIMLSTIGISVLIYVGSRLLHTLKTPETPVALKIYRSHPEAPRSRAGMARRRIDLKTGIICSLPIHQSGGPGALYSER